MQPSTSYAKDDKIVLYGTNGAFVPGKTKPEDRPIQALNLFQGLLCNSPEQREALGNVIMAWEQIPKFCAEHLNTREGIVPNDFVINFNIWDKPAKMTLFPGTYYPKRKGATPMRRYPGVKEQAVEQALIHHACLQAEAQTVNGTTEYYVTFSLNSLAKILKSMGSTMSHGQIREALEVLSSSIMTIAYGEDLIKDNRDSILPSFDRNRADNTGENGNDQWRVKLHSLIAHSILNVTYRQFPLGLVKRYTPAGAYLIRLMHFVIPNVSFVKPLSFNLAAMKPFTPGMNHVRLAGSLAALQKEFDKMIEDGLLDKVEIVEIFPERRPRGRPVPIDYHITLFPGDEWIKNVKAASTRMGVSEQSLGLPRSERQQRQMSLPNL